MEKRSQLRINEGPETIRGMACIVEGDSVSGLTNRRRLSPEGTDCLADPRTEGDGARAFSERLVPNHLLNCIVKLEGSITAFRKRLSELFKIWTIVFAQSDVRSIQKPHYEI